MKAALIVLAVTVAVNALPMNKAPELLSDSDIDNQFGDLEDRVTALLGETAEPEEKSESGGEDKDTKKADAAAADAKAKEHSDKPADAKKKLDDIKGQGA